MFGGSNLTVYFTQAYIDIAYTEALVQKSQLESKTSLNDCVKLYDAYYKKLVVEFENGANYKDVKYKTTVKAN